MAAPTTLRSGRRHSRRRLFAPEIIQTSMMDCGPASLKSLLEGHGIRVDYAKLREICYTDVDGTSIDTLEELAVDFGLDAEQVVVPLDYVFEPELDAFPCLAVIVLPTGATHFCVPWSRVGDRVQVMDPATGRRWLSRTELKKQLYQHTMAVDAATWREWAAGSELRGPLRRRLLRLGLDAAAADNLLASAQDDSTWRSYATLDAAARMTDVILSSGSLPGRAQTAALLKALYNADRNRVAPADHIIPPVYWLACDHSPFEHGEGEIVISGAVLIRVRGVAEHPEAGDGASGFEAAAEGKERLESKIAAASRPHAPALWRLLGYLRQDGLLSPLVLGAMIILSALAVFFEALLFKTLLEMGRFFGLVEQQIGFVASLVVFALAVLFLELSNERRLVGLGRRLEARFRLDFLRKVPRLADSYFASRLTSDLAERIHAVQVLRGLPRVGARMLRNVCVLALTAAGIIWINPECAPWALLAAGASIAVPLAFHRSLSEVQHSVRTYQGSLTTFYLDALLGLTPLLTHGASRAIKAGHETVLSEWANVRLRQTRLAVALNFCVAMVGIVLTVLILYVHLSESSRDSAVLLLVYWALALPDLGSRIAADLLDYPVQRSVALRLFEPLDAEEERELPSAEFGPSEPSSPDGVAIEFDDVRLDLADQCVLRGLSLSVSPGERVAVVGASGAGKSTMLGLVLGWHSPSSGQLSIDGQFFDKSRLDNLWRTSAWVDPQIQIWNRSVLANLSYGQEHRPGLDIAGALEVAQLSQVVSALPEGLCEVVGEGGGLLSEGEGQRLRFGRALLRKPVRLVVMDEPFRGLDRSQRQKLLRRALDWWKGATVLVALHDVREAVLFDQVVVIANGHVVEVGPPAELLANPNGQLRQMMSSDEALEGFFEDPLRWRRCVVANKTVDPPPAEEAT